MRYFIFNFEHDQSYIASFLEAASAAHNYPVKTEEWFRWKFRDNPYGPTILSCAEEDGQIVGCVAFGMQLFSIKKKIIRGGLSFENFVHPNYQRKGIFKELICLSQKEALRLGIDILFVFPNSNSLSGYKRMNWSILSRPEYWINERNLLSILPRLLDIRKLFKPNTSNLNLLKGPSGFKQYLTDSLTFVISYDYLIWRFFTFPVAEYVVMDSENYYSVIRVGYRGRLKEAQVLFISFKTNKFFEFLAFLKDLKRKLDYDIISFTISKSNSIRKHLRYSLFKRVPNNINVCYKILNTLNVKEEDVKNISLNAINFHTY